jgi:shikimate kinase
VSRPLVVLVGPPGAGKSTVGHLLANLLGQPFRDTDADVEAAVGKSIADIFYDDGEDAFRAHERAAVARALAEHEGVLSLGGGAVLDAGTRATLAEVRVVFLDVSLADAARRTGLSAARPLLALNPRATLQQLLAERRPHYLEVADAVVSTAGREPAEIASEIAGIVRM